MVPVARMAGESQDYANVTNVLKMAKRIKAAGMLLHLDFHYSDWFDQIDYTAHIQTNYYIQEIIFQNLFPTLVRWADPSQQVCASANVIRRRARPIV